MKKNIHRALLVLLSLMLLAGCALRPDRAPSPSTLYDLGPLPSSARTLPAVQVSIAEVNVPAWLDSPTMFYRLDYANPLQPRTYTQNRWVMPPAHLFGQRLKARIAQAGGIAATATDAASNLSLVRIEAVDFIQVFDAPEHSRGEIAMRVSIFTGRTLVSQKSFSAQVAAPSNDAGGGASALATASDAVIDQIVAWLATLPLRH